MKFLKSKNAHGAVYSIFELESTKEKDFFNIISPVSKNSIFGKLPKSIQSWLINSNPPAIISGEKNSIMIISSNPYESSFGMFSAEKSKPINDFLDYMFKEGLIENIDLEGLKQNPILQSEITSTYN